MSEPAKPKRSYTSTRRKSQAKETRRLIIEAAKSLFYERGFNNATIEAIAEKAGVAPETIYAVFGNKQAILLKLIETTLVGDMDPTHLLARPFIIETLNESDQKLLIKKFASDIYIIMTRMSPIFSLLQTTSKSDPEIMTMLNKLLKERLEGMAFFVNQLQRIGPIREQMLPDQAPVSVWAISSAEIFDLLTQKLNWSEEQYIAWLSNSLERLLLP